MFYQWVFIFHPQVVQLLPQEKFVYKAPNLFPNAFVVASPDTFSNTESKRHNRIVLFSYSYVDIHVGVVRGSIVTHWSLSTNRSSIVSFHSWKLFPLNFPISIFELLTIYFHHKNRYHKDLIVTMFITNSKQTLSHKGISLKPITTLIPNVSFKLFTVMQCTHKFLTQKIKQFKSHIYIEIYPGKRKTNKLFRVAPLTPILLSTSLFTIQYIWSCSIEKNPNPLTQIILQP